MRRCDNVYNGFKCLKCGLWFCRNYLFEQHNRRVHNHLGDFIVLPALSPETLLYLNETKETPFAIMHIPTSENRLLMRLTNVETHCTARIATEADLLQHRTKQDNEAVEMIGIAIVLDIYPNRDRTGTVSYGIVSRINAKLLQTRFFCKPPQHTKQNTNRIGYSSAAHVRSPHTLTHNNHSLDGGGVFQHSHNPFCDELERLTSLL
ncbi:uncharacterized protein LOC126572784 [Anopheles aquasalis]|uniref:uncharacterized protein LOC126572784 n=1 Tax=Anopheles aquasalis TaxID=42839 RepID=UPI00215AE796|nr:uncharacterized protein LOC126572784 [Anopheles aquasalis]